VAAERDPETGRFLAGNNAGPLGAGAKQAARLHAALKSVTGADVQAVFAGLLDKARTGDAKAAELWLSYVVGKAPQYVGLMGPDGKPAIIIREIVVEKRPPPGVIVAPV